LVSLIVLTLLFLATEGMSSSLLRAQQFLGQPHNALLIHSKYCLAINLDLAPLFQIVNNFIGREHLTD
jgi:hypothetical protein